MNMLLFIIITMLIYCHGQTDDGLHITDDEFQLHTPYIGKDYIILRWNNFHPLDVLIKWVVFYRHDARPSDVSELCETRTLCAAMGWEMKDSNPSSPGDQYVTGLLNNLQPDTEYTIFVRTLTKNGQESRSPLINIHTDPFDGQVPDLNEDNEESNEDVDDGENVDDPNQDGKRGKKGNKRGKKEKEVEFDPMEPWWNETTANGTYYPHPREAFPGFRARITQKGFNYAAQFATDFLTAQLTKLKIPDVEEEIATAKVRVIDVTVVDFPPPKNKISIIPNKGLRWRAWGMEPVFTAVYGAVVGFGFFSIQKEGNVTVYGSDIKFNLDFIIERDPNNGRPFLLTTECTAEGNVEIQFEGGWSEMLNAGSTVFQSFIQSTIMDQICSQAKTEINVNMQSELHTLPMRERVADLFELDFGFTHFPTFKRKYLETAHFGTVYYAKDPHEPPFQPPEIPVFSKHTKRMMYMYVTDYVVNSGLYAGFISGQMQYNVTKDIMDLAPPEALTMLKIGCGKPDICIGSVFPQLTRTYPSHMLAEVDMKAIRAPKVEFLGGNKATLYTYSEASFFMTHGGQQRRHLFTAEMNSTSTVVIKVNGSLVSFDIKDMTPTGLVTHSSIGAMHPGFAFDELLKIGAEKFIMQKIATIARSGFQLPSTEEARFENSQIIKVKNKGLFVVATDIFINPELDLQALIEQGQREAAAKKAAMEP